MDKGIPLPELPLDPIKIQRGPDPRATLVHGIVWTALGIGSMIAMAVFQRAWPCRIVGCCRCPSRSWASGLILYVRSLPPGASR
jgi:hypothetical protein